MTPEQWIAKQIKDHGIKQRFISDKTGLSYQKISASLTGRRHFKTEEFLSVCVVTGINPVNYPVHVGGGADA